MASVICSACTTHSLPAVEVERTLLLRSGEVKVRIRRSERARRVRLVLPNGGGPELVIPHGARTRAIDEALEKLTPWLERTLARRQLPALGLTRPGIAWHGGEAIPLRVVRAQRISADWSAGALELRARDDEGAATALERWYRASAREALLASIERQVPPLGVAPKAVAVRDQRTRWGSCSSSGTLSFSWRLLLAPAWVLDDVVCHELVHMLVPNHSARFWQVFAASRPGADSRPWLRAHGGELATYRPADSIGAA
jgi:predicted metal-dependent hydrolase